MSCYYFTAFIVGASTIVISTTTIPIVVVMKVFNVVTSIIVDVGAFVVVTSIATIIFIITPTSTIVTFYYC